MAEKIDFTVHKGYSLAATAELFVDTTSIETRHEVAPGWSADSKFEPCVCLWDTESTFCGISDTLADKWELETVGSATTRIGNDEVHTNPLYTITLRLDDGSEHLITAKRQHITGVDVIIGLSLICDGIFTLTPTAGHGAIFTFEIPKSHNDTMKYLR